MTTSAEHLVSARVNAAVFVLALIVSAPAPASAAVEFTWIPTDGSASSGSMTVDAPASGAFTVSETAVRSFNFTFRPGLSVSLRSPADSGGLMSYDGGGLDYGAFALSRAEPVVIVFSFLPEQLGADVAHYNLNFRVPYGPPVVVYGKWVRLDLTVPKPQLPRGILGAIDIRAIVDRDENPDANVLGVAYNPDADVLYLAHGSDPRGGFIYTLDMTGRLLSELDFQSAYRAGSYPTSLSYDPDTGHLFVFAFVEGTSGGHLVEMNADGSTIFREIALPPNHGGFPMVREDGIWQPQDYAIRHYSLDGVFIEDISVSGSFPVGSSGPSAVSSSFAGTSPDGFFLVDFGGQRIVEVDNTGREISAVTTAVLGDTVLADGRASAIATDPARGRIFLVGNNKFVYILSSDFMKIQTVNHLLRLHDDEVRTAYDSTPVPAGPVGTFTIDARFENVSDQDICSPFFQVVELSVDGNRADRLESISIEPTGHSDTGL